MGNKILQIQTADKSYQCSRGDNYPILNNSNLPEGAVCFSTKDDVIPGEIKGMIELDQESTPYEEENFVPCLISVLNLYALKRGQDSSIFTVTASTEVSLGANPPLARDR